MKLGITYGSFEHDPAHANPVGEALQQINALGLDALELAVDDAGAVHIDSSQGECEAIRRQIDAAGVHVSTVACGLSWAMNPVAEDAETRERSRSAMDAALQRAAWLGCEAFLYVPGIVGCPFVPDQKVRYDVALERCRENVKRLLETAERVGVDLCLENVWNGMFLSPLELRDFVDSFGSDRLGVYFDVGNCLGYHQDPPHWIELLGQRVKRGHIKDFRHDFAWQGRYDFCRLGEGDVPWPETVAALRAVGYDRTVIAEMLPPAPGLLEHTAGVMKRLFA